MIFQMPSLLDASFNKYIGISDYGLIEKTSKLSRKLKKKPYI